MFALVGYRLDARECAIKDGCRLTLLWVQIEITRTYRQSVPLPHDRRYHDLDVEIQIAHHTSNDDCLGRIFLPKESDLRLRDVEQLRHHGRDPAKVPWSRAAAQLVTQSLHRDKRYAALGIHFFAGRGEQYMHSFLLEKGPVAIQVAGILGKILTGSKLDRIYENRNCHQIASRP